MEHGELIKKLRTDRKITRRDLSEGVHSISALQRFENDTARIDIDTIWQYLERMNIQIDDYYLEYYNYQLSKKEHLRKKFRSAIISEYHAKEYLDNLQEEYKKSNDIFFLYLIVQIKAVAEKLPNYKLGKIDENESKKILDYLSRIEEWGYFELAMYTNCLGLFKKEYRLFQYKDVLNQFRKFKGIPKYQHALIKFIINSIILEFSDKNYDRILDLLGILYDETKDSDYLKGRIYWKFFFRLYQSVVGDLEFDGSIAIEMLRLLGYEEEAVNFLDIERTILDDHT
ncbi:helix-turn-helix domain-containing protein [Enterococcus mundtii]|uniref:Rgg family transcriptional regulator n=1 Tax=Enterococcus TaxID=1350 RepID=UPI00129C8E77|nr:helix-turn-helix domain-containing protein [Enterococcus mundtii]MBE9910303.1 helix-turn-helix domain-containing protein [Enterococcus mundtii]MCA6773398.1 helix-turn-helix domain-containing protein [Enterococcus mundtii]MRI73216.1 helix-turn-helix domain-containing protein [Enterococcus mundtii]UBM05359.1 helix-turn-helix domain-containing protein [Enterococcus mundtii]GKS55559.1 MutR family transcriptional regulator [Enterococcus mundtii]